MILIFNHFCNKLPQIDQPKIPIIYYFMICVGEKSRWAQLGGYKAKIKVSESLGSYQEVLEENMIQGSYRLLAEFSSIKL